MRLSSESKDLRDKYNLTLVGPIPTDEQGWQRVKRHEAIARDAMERLLSEPREVTLKRWRRLREKDEQITFLDLLDKNLKKIKAKTPDAEFLRMLCNIASIHSPLAVAKYIGLPDSFIESLASAPVDELTASLYNYGAGKYISGCSRLKKSIDIERSYSMAYTPLVEAIFEGYLGHYGWLQQAEIAFNSYLHENMDSVVLDCSPDLLAVTFRDLEREIKIDLRDVILIYCSHLASIWIESDWNNIKARINSSEAYYRLIEVAIWYLGCELTEDLTKLCDRFSKSEQEDQYYYYGRGNFTRKIEKKFTEEITFNETVLRDEDRLIYLLKRGGYRHPEIRDHVSNVANKRLTEQNIRQRYSRINRRLQEKW